MALPPVEHRIPTFHTPATFPVPRLPPVFAAAPFTACADGGTRGHSDPHPPMPLVASAPRCHRSVCRRRGERGVELAGG